MNRVASWLLASLLAGCAGTQAPGEAPVESYAPPPRAVLTPDLVRTRIGTLGFFDGLPDAKTVETVYDHLDFMRAARAFLRTVPGASMVAMRQGLYDAGALPNYTVLVTEATMDARSLFLTPSSHAVYATAWIDLKGGPIVIETPPYVEGALHDFWGRHLIDTGKAGPDRGRGGMYVVVPPGYEGLVPKSEFAVRSRTYGVWAVFRGPLIGGRPEPAVGSFKKYLKIYPLKEARRPPPNPFVDISGLPLQTIHPSDASYFERIHTLVREEPAESQDPEVLGLLASIGIEKGKRFAPDARMKAILAEAATVGDASARALLFSPRDPDAYLYEDRQWQTLLGEGGRDFIRDGVGSTDARVRFHYFAAIDASSFGPSEPESASQAAMAFRDAKGRLLDGSRTYTLTLPPEIPAEDLWSVTVYDNETRSLLQTDQRFGSVSDARGEARPNRDGSITIDFGPRPPRQKRKPNWIQTVPGKGWHAVLRLRGAGPGWFDRTWRPGDIELLTEIPPAKRERKRPKMWSDVPASLRAPRRVETNMGVLELVHGVPTEQTTKRLYEHLDFIRGVDAFLHTVSGASRVAIRRGFRSVGVDDNATVAIFDRAMDSHTLFLTGDTESIYAGTWLDLRDGAMIVQSPPDAVGVVDDFFGRRVAAFGDAGPDEGAGGLFLFAPPQYQGQLSEQYFIFKSPTYGNLLLWRALDAKSDRGVAADAMKAAIRIDPFDVPLLEDLGLDAEEGAGETTEEPPVEEEEEMRFIGVSGRPLQTIFPNDFGYYEHIDTMIQEEPAAAFGPEILGLLAAVGIEKGKPFAPDARMKAILVEAAAVANASARALAFRPRNDALYLDEGSTWYHWHAAATAHLRDGVRLLDARATFFYLSATTSPAMVEEQVGSGVAHVLCATDANGKYLDGGRTYRLTLPANVPAGRFWSLVVYDPQTRSMLQTPRTARPSVSSEDSEIAPNEDGSKTLYFGPTPPTGSERNWIQTVPGKGWFVMLRLYQPLGAWFDGSWQPGAIEPVDSWVE